MTVLAFTEQPHLLPEALTWAKTLAEKLGTETHAALLDGMTSEQAGRYGAMKVYLFKEMKRDAVPQLYAQALAQLARETKAAAIVIPATKSGREAAARLAHILRVGCANDCIEVEPTEDGLKVVRQVYGGGYVAQQLLKRRPYVVTAQPGRVQPSESPTQPEVSEVTLELKAAARIVETKPIEKSGVDLEKAELIVSVGRGFRRKEDLKLAEELAKVLGAEVGCTRPIAGDLKWLPEDRHIGLSGKRVRPKLYLALGISGQIQHLVGMRDSKVVVSVNTDPNALITQEADYVVVADLYKFVPEFMEALKRELGR